MSVIKSRKDCRLLKNKKKNARKGLRIWKINLKISYLLSKNITLSNKKHSKIHQIQL